MSEVLERDQDVVRPGKVAKWGNGPAVRIAVGSLKRANLRVDDAIEVIARDGEIVIRRQRPKLVMSDLLARFDPSLHRHSLAFDGAPRGSETPLHAPAESVDRE